MTATTEVDERTTIEGCVTVIRQERDSGWKVLTLQAPGSRTSVDVAGMAPGVYEGASVTARGMWITHPRFGRQFKADYVQLEVPTDTEGLARYLGSGKFRGIGDVLARRIVKAHGLNTLRVVREQPGRIARIRGMSLPRARELAAAVRALGDEVEALAALRTHMGPKAADNVVARHGTNAVAMLKDNPYALAGDVAGLGFKRADAIARSQGVSEVSTERLRAAAQWVVKEGCERGGHTTVPLRALNQKVASTLNLELSLVEREGFETVQWENLVLERQDGEVFFTQSRIYEDEVTAAKWVAKAALHPIDRGESLTLRARIREAERATGRPPLDEAQRRGVVEGLRRRISVITGGPGTGKSATLAVLCATSGRAKTALCAPTGKASRRMREVTGADARTIHALLGYNPAKGYAYNRDNRLPYRYVIVDEASMMDLGLFAALVRALRDDATLILLGDVNQLPSVGGGKVLADLIDSGVVPVTRLERVYRQGAGSLIVHNAARVISGQPPDLANQSPEFRVIDAPTPESAQRVCLQEVDSWRTRQGYDLFEDIQTLVAMNKGPVGVDALNAALQKLAPLRSPERVITEQETFRVGDKIMHTRSNNIETGVMNGDLGRVVGLTSKKDGVRAEFDGVDGCITYQKDRLWQLRLAYAMTIHRSQGSEAPAFAIPIAAYNRMMLDRQLLYTAITRAKQEVRLIGPWSMIEQCVRAEPRPRYTLLRERIVEAVAARV